MVTYDVSLDEPVSQLTFYRMVQAAVARANVSAPQFKIEYGKSVLGRVSGVLYSVGVALGAKVIIVVVVVVVVVVLVVVVMLIMIVITAGRR
jgi:hypothetical protein